VFQVTGLCILLGMLLALSLKTQRQAASEGIPNRAPALRTLCRQLKSENDKLQKDLADYKANYEELLRKQARGQAGAVTLDQVLTETKVLAGTAPAHGPGVVVTLRDSPKVDPAETRPDVISTYMVHDTDIRAVVNELFAAGAEAVSVNDQRLIATSSIRCVGPVVLVNSVQVAPPYVVKAIGKPDVLEKALEMQGGPADELFPLDMIEIRKQPDIYVPAYTGSTRFTYAKPLEKRKKED
jgi:uncharacterized protein YlxW (UPF0749 family)